MDETRLRGELREAAAAHRPDHARMLARVERGMAAPAPRRAGRPRRRWTVAAAVAATVAGVLGLGGLAVTALQDRPAPPAGAAPAPGPAARAAGTIDAGSNRWWAQSDLAVTTETEVTALTVELRVALTGGIADTGHWQTRPADDFTATVAEEDGALVYRWTLKEGRAVPPGPHTFAAQYNHAEGTRDASADAYTVVLTARDGGRTILRGGFG
ncbi:hypothetical protein HHL19_20745 [Streptomyces sp. R302]|uniref:hypothetical protein n=1 Tax=unclassified Streptomyces TaxID=2593676 RepID=UPI00145DF8B3|nr:MULTISPECIES: hypothetical protein [unclassified Streptomyces]NML50935.1 hypothetical protein [Streptomyces sp. R301]NML81029.1 hypothetical protein [Streptomyces sp. R302]